METRSTQTANFVSVDKRGLIQMILADLKGQQEELQLELHQDGSLTNSPENSQRKVQAKSQDKFQDLSERLNEVRQKILLFRLLPIREYGEGDVVCPSALVELRLNGRISFYLVVPKGGGPGDLLRRGTGPSDYPELPPGRGDHGAKNWRSSRGSGPKWTPSLRSSFDSLEYFYIY